MSSAADSPSAALDSQVVQQHSGQAALADLRRHWGDAYEIARVETWTARVPGEADALTASTAVELEALLCRDHLDRQAGTRSGSVRTNMGQGERALRQLRDDGVI